MLSSPIRPLSKANVDQPAKPPQDADIPRQIRAAHRIGIMSP